MAEFEESRPGGALPFDALFDERAPNLAGLARLVGREASNFFVGRDFRGLLLRGIDVRSTNLSRADLRGTFLREALVDRTTSLDGAILDGEDRCALAASGIIEPPPGFSLEKARELILSAMAPPESWRPWIMRLNLKGETIADLAPIVDLTALEWLDLQDTQVDNIAELTGLIALRRLNLAGTRVEDISPLSALTQLELLDIWGTRVIDITPLAGLKNLSLIQ